MADSPFKIGSPRDLARRSSPDQSLVRGRVQPQANDVEEVVLGALMLDKDAISVVLDILQPDSFYTEGHQAIYKAMLTLFDKNSAIDLLTVKDQLQKTGELDKAGGPYRLVQLSNRVGSAANVEYHARIIAQKSIARDLIKASSEVLQDAYDDTVDVFDLLDEAEKKIFKITEDKLSRGVESIAELGPKALKLLEEIKAKSAEEGGLTGVPTGFTDLDKVTNGWQPSDMIVLAARPGMGKTAFVLSIARNAAMDFGKGVAIFSLEMANVQLVQRLLSMEAQVDSKKMRSGQMSDEEWDKLQQGIERLSAAPIYIDDTPAINIFELRAKCRRLKMQHDIQLVVIDYLQLMSGNSTGKQTNREQEISAISRNLKQLAKEINVPVIALSQLSRAVEQRGGDKRPMLSDLRECVPGHTLVCLADGRRIPIRDLVGTRPEVLSVDERGRVVAAESDLVWSVGRKKTYRITLRSGRAIEATAEHRLRRFGAWATVAELEVGDRLAAARCLPQPPALERWPEHEVVLLGQLIGDGSYLSGQPMRYTSNHEDNLAAVKDAAEAFGCTIRRYDHPKGWTQLLISGNGNRWHPAGVNKWLRELGIFGQRSHEKRVPERAFRLGDDQIGTLLRHLWATDGTIYTRPGGRKGSYVIQYATNSHGLATDVQALLLRLGITARVRHVQQGDYRPGYHVIVSGARAQRVFLDAVGGLGPRAEQAETLSAALASVTANPNADTVPVEVFDLVRLRMHEPGITHRQMAALRGTSYGGNAHFSFAPSREVVADYASHLADPTLERYATDDLYWDEIVSIEAIGEQEVFDLTVPGPHSWLADGIVSHNSGAIEQDADMVNFIYRPEYYDIDQDQDGNSLKGVAKIIVAKNRHGELRDVQLRWVAEQARFDNWEDVDFNAFTNLSPFQPDGGDGSVTLQSRVNTDDEEIAF